MHAKFSPLHFGIGLPEDSVHFPKLLHALYFTEASSTCVGDLLLSKARWINLFNYENQFNEAHYYYAFKSQSPNSSIHTNLAFLISLLCVCYCLVAFKLSLITGTSIRASYSVFSQGLSVLRYLFQARLSQWQELWISIKTKPDGESLGRKEKWVPVSEIQPIYYANFFFHFIMSHILKLFTQARWNVGMQQLLSKFSLVEKTMPH